MNKQDFWANMKQDENGCLLWTRHCDQKGYGITYLNGVAIKAHRRAWELTYNPLPPEIHLHHNPTCPKRCCNVDHLSPLTGSEHWKLTHKLGEIDYSKQSGEKSPHAKLTDAQVDEILALRSTMSQQAIADKYGISRQYISKLEWGIRRRFRHLTK